MNTPHVQPDTASKSDAAPATVAALGTGQHRVLAMIASGAPLRATLQALLELVELECPDMLT